MTLTLSHGPLSGRPPETVNYRIEGPSQRLLFHDFPRRVRAVFAGETVADTARGKLLHETGLLPVLYIPTEDVRQDLLEPSDHTTHCPFKGDASYSSVRVADRIAENAVWSYPEPFADAAWLRGYVCIYWNAMDAWFDEDEEVHGHLRDPYHRVDVRESSRHVIVRAGGQTIAETKRPKLLSETGLPNRYYIPPEDVRSDLLEASNTRTVCPYKGTATYWSLPTAEGAIHDLAWSYDKPLEGAAKAAGHLCFVHDSVEKTIDGQQMR